MAKRINTRAMLGRLNRVRQTLPTKLANEAQNHFQDSFRKGGFEDRNLQKWQKRKAGTKRDKGRAILVDSGDLRDNFKKFPSWRRIRIVNLQPYGTAHNRGTNRLPQRQFMGSSEKLRQKISKKIRREVGNIFKTP